MGQHSAKVGQHSPKMDQHSRKMGQHSLRSCSQLDPYHLNMGPWPAVAHKRLNPARGPRGPELAVALPYGTKERGAAAPAAYHKKVPRFTVSFAVPIFRLLWPKMDQHGPT